MTEISKNINIDAHYSTSAKVQKPSYTIVSAPNSLPKGHLFNDKDANNRFKILSQDIYNDSKREEKRHATNFIKIFGAGIIGVLAFLGLKKVLKKS